MKTRLKINGIIIFSAVMLLVFFPALFLRNAKESRLDEAIEIFGIGFILLGQILRVSGRGYKSEHSGNGHSLIQGGPYALVRNPMYLGILLIGLGVVLILFNWWVGAVFLCVFIWRYILLMLKEEKKLLGLFPDAYRDYQQRVPRILPSASVLLKKDMAEYLPLKPIWLKREIGSMVALLLPVFFWKSWQAGKAEGIKAYLNESALFLSVIILFTFLIIYLIRRTSERQTNASGKS